MKPLYKQTFEQAKSCGETEQFRESFKENIACRDFLDKEVREKFDGFHLPSECAKNSVKEYGFDRTMWVIANTILERHGDGRFHKQNTDWAKNMNIPKNGRNYEFSLKSHSCIVDGLADQVRDMYAKLDLFSGKHIVQSEKPQDYTGKLLILKPEVLKEECRTPENQLFFATGGFGCSPDNIGSKVFGKFLSDGEETHFYRFDFIGIISNEFLPQWAEMKMQEMQSQQEQNAPQETINLNM